MDLVGGLGNWRKGGNKVYDETRVKRMVHRGG